MPVTEYQNQLRDLFHSVLNQDAIIEWRTAMNAGLYSPIVDVSVGPYAIEDGIRLTEEHLILFNHHTDFFESLAERHLINIGVITNDITNEQRQLFIQEKMLRLRNTNWNGRCFIAIEIENSVSRKHLMGGAINCSALGKIGIAVGYNDEKHRAFLNLYRYFRFLQDVEKPTFNTSNLLIISRDQLLEILEQFV